MKIADMEMNCRCTCDNYFLCVKGDGLCGDGQGGVLIWESRAVDGGFEEYGHSTIIFLSLQIRVAQEVEVRAQVCLLD